MADDDIARLNIAHFRKLLATKMDDKKQQTVLRLLAEEQTKLAALNNVSNAGSAALWQSAHLSRTAIDEIG